MLQCTADSLFVSPAQTLVNTVNTVGVMGKGIAREFRRRYPQMFGRYKDYCDRGKLEVGQLYLYRTPNKWVLNFPTKKHWRGKSQLEWIEAGLQKFVDSYESRGITSVSFPQLGCGNGGLLWRDVGPVMESYLGGLPIPVLIHIRARPPGFVPEHEEPEDVASFSSPREQIAVEKFVEDLFGVLGRKFTRGTDSDDEDAPPAVPDLRLSEAVTLTGSELESLWYLISRRGALRFDQFPGRLSQLADELTGPLLQLDYLRPISFVRAGGRGDPELIDGVRFAPGPMTRVTLGTEPQLPFMDSAQP